MKMIIIALACGIWLSATARSQELIVDVSEHLISVHPSFTGAEVLLFGAKQAGGDVVVVLRGPPEDLVVRRKQRVAGIWVNRAELGFVEVPSYYAVSATRPLSEIGTAEMRRANGLGTTNLDLQSSQTTIRGDLSAFAEALVRNKQADGLYTQSPLRVLAIDDKLFRTSFLFPANTPIGTYQIDAYLIDDGRILSKRTTALQISKTGIQETIYSFAQNFALYYGLLAVAIALMAGWLAGVVFRKA